MPRPRLVATDLDGTLLNGAGKVSGRTREVLRALDERGVPVVFVTGRPIRWMDDLLDDVGHHGLVVCSNGGIVLDVPTGTVRSALTVPRELALQVALQLREEMPGTTFALEKTGGFAREDGFASRHPGSVGIPTGALESIFDDTVVKLLAMHEELAPEDYWRQARALVGHQIEVTWSSSLALLEMSAQGVTKATTLASLCAELAIDAREVVAFGDMPNDIPMLEWAGTSYAMAEAHPDVRRAADRVAPGNDEDGVAHVLGDLFDLPV